MIRNYIQTLNNFLLQCKIIGHYQPLNLTFNTIFFCGWLKKFVEFSNLMLILMTIVVNNKISIFYSNISNY